MNEVRAVVFVNSGTWIARCPICPGGAEYFGMNPHTGQVGLDGRYFRCSTCGFRCEAQWPPNVDDIARLLALRPVPFRNWEPPETIHDLLRENMEHGCIPADIEAGTQTLISIVGDTLAAGYSLPAPDRLALSGGGR